VEEHFELEDEVDVFVFKDSENRIVATTEIPLLYLGDFRYLTVIHVNPYGAFVDWGLDKDLLVPFSEQLHRLEQEEKYLFSLQYDNATDRLYGTMRVKKLLEPCTEDLNGQEVDIMICEENALGISVIVNNRYDGLIFRNNISKTEEVNLEFQGWGPPSLLDNFPLRKLPLGRLLPLPLKIVISNRFGFGHILTIQKMEPRFIK
jgi:predicted RNA-binding protein (virulence factor B family)